MAIASASAGTVGAHALYLTESMHYLLQSKDELRVTFTVSSMENWCMLVGMSALASSRR